MPQRLNTISRKPLIITQGDPCGIGPEIIAKSWSALRHDLDYVFAVIGDKRSFETLNVDTIEISTPHEAFNYFAHAIPVINRPTLRKSTIGMPQVDLAPFIISWIREAFELCLLNQACAMITAPIAKSVLYESGFLFPGHTEYLGELARLHGFENNPVMLLMADKLKVALATIHIPINLVSENLTIDKLDALCKVLNTSLKRDFKIAEPRIAVSALNPHAGENGTIGREEIEIISPFLASMKSIGINVTGPHPADTMFHKDAIESYDVALCMYHDQALIPLKTIDFWGGVNVTLNLPIIRTSPDHGTGFDIAGKNLARPDSMIQSIKAAHKLSINRGLI